MNALEKLCICEPQKPYVELKKSDTEKYISCDSTSMKLLTGKTDI